MQYISCPSCESSNNEELFSKGDLDQDLRNVVCLECALVFINPRDDLDVHEEFHDSGFLSNKGYCKVEDFEHKVSGSEKAMKQKVAQMLMKRLYPGSKVLDVGCGIGTLISILKEKGCEVEGIELAKVDVDAAKKFYDLDLYYGSLAQYGQVNKDKGFDMIILHHTLEHMPEPIAELKTIKKLLKIDGLLYIGVPNIMNIKKRPEVFFEKGHALSFSPFSLNSLLNKTGFYVTSFSSRASFPGGMDVIASSDKSKESNLDVKKMSYGSSCEEIKRYVAFKKLQYDSLRRARDLGLFMFPQKVRVKLGRGIYKALKKL